MDEQAQQHLFYEIFDPSFLRLGPGDDASTLRALNGLLAAAGRGADGPAPRRMSVLDIGCGTGAQTLQVARHLDGTIVAMDDHQPYLDEYVLPESSWWDSYYHPLEARLAGYRDKFPAGSEEREMVEGIQAEIDIRRRYGEYYWNVFFLLRRPG